LAAAGVELLLGLHDAVTYQEQEDAINKFGFALVDGTLGNILADVAGSSAGLATWYVNFLLSETRDALMAKHETAWMDAFAQWAIERDWVGRLSDKAALAKVVRTLKSGENLETMILQDLLDTLNSNDAEVRTLIPIFRGEGLAKDRNLAKKFVKKLLYTEEFLVGSGSEAVSLWPRSFYAVAHKKVVDEILRARALEIAHALVRTESVFWSRLDSQTYRGRFRVVLDGAETTGVSDLEVWRYHPEAIDGQQRWRTDAEGWFEVKVTGLDFSHGEELIFAVRIGSKSGSYFKVRKTDFVAE